MIARARNSIACGLLAAGCHAVALAQVIPWQLSGSFVDGAPVAGHFDYDPQSGSFANIAITSGPGNFLGATELLGWHYGAATMARKFPDAIDFLQIIPGPPPGVLNFYELVVLGFDPAIPQSATVDLSESKLLAVNSPLIPHGVWQSRQGHGTVFVTAIPEPGSAAMLLASLGLAGGITARRRLLHLRRRHGTPKRTDTAA